MSAAPPRGEAEVLARLIDALQGHLPGIVAGNLINAVALAVVLAGVAPGMLLWPWLVLQGVHGGFNAWSGWRLRGRPATPRNAQRRARAATWSSAASGALWAAALVLLWPAARIELQLLMILMVIGLVSGAMHSLTGHLPAFNAFLLPNGVATVGMCLWQGGLVHQVLAVVAAGYAVIAWRFARGVHRAQADALRQRQQLAALADSLRAEKDRAEQAALSRSRFLAAASHDLRQPVHALALFLGAMKGQPLGAEAKRLLRHASSTVDTMSALFNALLDISRLDAGMVQPEPRAVALAPLLGRVAAEEGVLAQARGLRLRLRLPRGGDALMTHSDALLLERIVRNLVANAVRYTARGGVLVALRRRDGGLLLQVWDTGIGIPPGRQHEVFQEFVQLHNPERDRSQGLGLGLAIVRRLVDLLGHRLTLHSLPGRGSVFSLALPLDSGRWVAPEASAWTTSTALPDVGAAAPATRGRLVLVIDDDAAIRIAMQGLLAGWGCTVLAAEGLDALMPALAREPRRPDLIVCDYRLRGSENGLAAVAALQAEYNHEIPAILITGDTAPERLREAHGSALTLLHKPVSPAALREAMNQLLAAAPAP